MPVICRKSIQYAYDGSTQIDGRFGETYNHNP